MSSIEIRKISITALDTDAVVNAANEGLWAGGGVCGAIFRAAGYDELQAACARIGHCDIGSAVITPGFRLKATYIIHAVGPVWAGGGRGEPELLYGAYRHSLALAAEHGCASIGFPLISAGIYGYPVEQAWQQAIRACADHLAGGGQLDVVFAVLDERVFALGMRTLQKLAPSFACAAQEGGTRSADGNAEAQLRRIRHYEAILDRANEALRAYPAAAETLEALTPELCALAQYYESPLWKQDFADDEAGLLPAELKRGVLSEDGVYDLLERLPEAVAARLKGRDPQARDGSPDEARPRF